MYDRLEPPKNNASADRVNELVTYLATRKEPQTKHVNTVMEMARQLAAADLQIQNLTQEIHSSVKQRDFEMQNGMSPDPYAAKSIKLPQGTRKVSIEL